MIAVADAQIAQHLTFCNTEIKQRRAAGFPHIGPSHAEIDDPRNRLPALDKASRHLHGRFDWTDTGQQRIPSTQGWAGVKECIHFKVGGSCYKQHG
jgi:hypothetical protein